MNEYIITSGWWCKADNAIDQRDKLLGSDKIREQSFFNDWYESIDKYTYPKKILIVDSNSPHKPPLKDNDPRLEYLSLDENAGHSTHHTGMTCGYTRAILTGMGYSISCNVDYWVYVEQDALLYGNEIIENAIKSMKGDILYGSGEGTPQVLQQSLIIMKTSYIPTFIKNYLNIKYRDKEISPELKFAVSSSKLYPLIPKFLLKTPKKKYSIHNLFYKVLFLYFLRFINGNSFGFGYGRKRPICFDDEIFYFQHAEEHELIKYKEICNEKYKKNYKNN